MYVYVLVKALMFTLAPGPRALQVVKVLSYKEIRHFCLRQPGNILNSKAPVVHRPLTAASPATASVPVPDFPRVDTVCAIQLAACPHSSESACRKDGVTATSQMKKFRRRVIKYLLAVPGKVMADPPLLSSGLAPLGAWFTWNPHWRRLASYLTYLRKVPERGL